MKRARNEKRSVKRSEGRRMDDGRTEKGEGAVNVNRCGHENKRVHGQSVYERNKCTQEHFFLHRRRKISATDATISLCHFSVLAHLINYFSPTRQ